MAAVGLLARALGFQHPPGAGPVWLERTGDGRLAFNMVEPVSGDLAELARDDAPPH